MKIEIEASIEFLNTLDIISRDNIMIGLVNLAQSTSSKGEIETPTLSYISPQKQHIKYDGTRTRISITNFIVESVYGSRILTLEKDENLLFQPNLVLSGERSDDYSQELAGRIEDEIIIFIDKGRFDSDFKIQVNSEHHLNKSIELPEIKSNFEREIKRLKGFLLRNLYPSILNFTEESAKYIFTHRKPALMIYATPKTYDYYFNMINSNIDNSEFRDLVLVYILGKEDYEHIEGRFFSLVGVSHTDFPSVKLHIKESSEIVTHKMEEEITISNIEKFVKDWEATYKKPEAKNEDL